MQTLIAGFGKAGSTLHRGAVLRAGLLEPALFDAQAHVVVDPRLGSGPLIPASAASGECIAISDVASVSGALDRTQTVVHLCTPPGVRLAMLRDLAGSGFRNFVIEKPLVADAAELVEIEALQVAFDLRITVVGNWLVSAVTRRLHAIHQSQQFGALNEIRIEQFKPRFERTIERPDHPTVFDVEVPHSVGVALLLAGNAKVMSASCDDLVVAGMRIANMGSGRLELLHGGGTTTRIVSDLAAPIRKRSVSMVFERATLTGHYPVSSDDNYGQIEVERAGEPVERELVYDDSFVTFITESYRYFAGLSPAAVGSLEFTAGIVRLIETAKRVAGAAGRSEAGLAAGAAI